MTMKIMIILPNEAWKLISEYKNQGVTHFMLYCIHQCRVNEVSGIKVITKANNTQALPASRLPSQPPPHATAASDFSFQALSDICSCSIITSLHSEFVSPLIAFFVCQRYSNLSQSAEKKRKEIFQVSAIT